MQLVRQPVPLADGAGAPQRGVPALERLLLLLALGQRGERRRAVPRGPPPPTLMPPPHYCRGQANPAWHLRLISMDLFQKRVLAAKRDRQLNFEVMMTAVKQKIRCAVKLSWPHPINRVLAFHTDRRNVKTIFIQNIFIYINEHCI